MSRSKHPRGVSRLYGYHLHREKENGGWKPWRPKERDGKVETKQRSKRKRVAKG